jgi:predicted Ser/Thr protein kinase
VSLLRKGSGYRRICHRDRGGLHPGAESKECRTTGSRSGAGRVTSRGRFAPGDLLGGRYRIVAMLGKGGMGEVYRADDLTLDQPVALKFLPEAVAQNEEALARFRNEVRIARQVSHPNVCRVYDFGEVAGHYFLSMEYVDGEDLGSLLRRIGRLPTDKALEIARKLCAGLAAAHEKGILHRDLKPGNVMLDGRGQVLLTDFGLAGLAEDFEGAEVRNGTPAYMAPEQLAGQEVTVRSDIYALGLVLYEIFTGKLPFESNTLADLMRAQKESSPVSPSTLVRDLDPTVERVILRCLQAKPALRPASALAVAAALPGGDPLAAALAAGETPSPEMVAAAGEGEGMALWAAAAVFVAILAAIVTISVAKNRDSALERLRPEYPPEVLAQKARDIVERLGLADIKRVDDAYGFYWSGGLLDYMEKHEKPSRDWGEFFAQKPPLLLFWYRQAADFLTASEFHDDLLTPGMVRQNDPASTQVGMVDMVIDSRGRLLRFQRIPEEHEKPAQGAAPAPDWKALFREADLDPARFQSAGPEWNSLAVFDSRSAWTGTWPGTARPIRVEAAAGLLFDHRAVDAAGPKPERRRRIGEVHHSGRGLPGSPVCRADPGARQSETGPGRPARRIPAGGVHLVRPGVDLADAVSPGVFERNVRHVPARRLHFGLLRRGDLDRVHGPGALCAKALAAVADLLVERVDRAVARPHRRTRRVDRIGAGGESPDGECGVGMVVAPRGGMDAECQFLLGRRASGGAQHPGGVPGTGTARNPRYVVLPVPDLSVPGVAAEPVARRRRVCAGVRGHGGARIQPSLAGWGGDLPHTGSVRLRDAALGAVTDGDRHHRGRRHRSRAGDGQHCSLVLRGQRVRAAGRGGADRLGLPHGHRGTAVVEGGSVLTGCGCQPASVNSRTSQNG